MSGKTFISLTDEQEAFARGLVEDGRFASVSDVVQQGLDLLRAEMEGEVEPLVNDALRELLEKRRKGPFITGEEMDARIRAYADKMRRAVAEPCTTT